jgi:hypothetical protein
MGSASRCLLGRDLVRGNRLEATNLSGADPRAIRERVAGKLLMLDRALDPLLTPLLTLLWMFPSTTPRGTPPTRHNAGSFNEVLLSFLNTR